MKQLILLFLFYTVCGYSQTTIAFQGAEGTAADNWGYAAITNAGGPIPPGPVATLPRTGSKALRAAGGNTSGCGGGSNCISSGGATSCPMHGNTITFDAINTSCLSGVVLTCYHRSHTACSGSGFDSGDYLYFEVRLNGGAWTTVATVAGSGDYVWTYTTNPAGSGTTAPNPFTYSVPAGTNSFEFRVRATVNRSDEVFYIDDVKLTTTTTGYSFPGTAGLWGGYVSTDWFNACNWNDRTVPTSTTNVTFPSNNTGNRDIVINSATNPTCNNLTLNGSGSKQIKGEGDATKKLTINGNLTIATTDGLDFSDGTSGTADGTIELYGNWTNSGVESDFKEGNSVVKLMGTANQTITTADTEEAFYSLVLNKASGTVTMNDDVWIDKDFEGGTSALLIFTQGKLDLNGHELKVWNDNEQAVSRSSGGVISEKTNNSSKMTWFINSNTGAHIFPFTRTDNFYIPFTFDLTAGDVNDVTVSTYPTANNNTPYPVTPQTVTHVNDAAGLDNSANTVNRFWQIDKTGSSGTANLTFTYGDNEWDVLEPGNYEAQRWASGTWQAATSGQVQNVSANSVYVPGITTFSPWTLAVKLFPLPVELVDFKAMYKDEVAKIEWITFAESNNDYFTVERSADGIHFSEVFRRKGAGNSRSVIMYEGTDPEPFTPLTYYRLKQTDFNRSEHYSNTVLLERSLPESITVFPNPTGDRLMIKRSNNDKLDIKLMNVSGNVLMESTSDLQLAELNLSKLESGIYILHLQSNNLNTYLKVIRN